MKNHLLLTLSLAIASLLPAVPGSTIGAVTPRKQAKAARDIRPSVRTEDLRVRDPFILRDKKGVYTLIKNAHDGKRFYLEAYQSRDLRTWTQYGPVFRPDSTYLGTNDYWAPDLYYYKGNYYVFVTMRNASKGILRGTTILKSKRVTGPYRPVLASDRLNVTPKHMQCLDGSLYVAPDGKPWMVFCVEWNGPNVKDQVGEVWAMPLKDDLSDAAGEPVYLFKATDAPWTNVNASSHVTDAPVIITDPATGHLIMTWSSFTPKGHYAIGQAYSRNGLLGPWEQDPQPIFADDGGHAMTFSDTDGQLWLSFHSPNARNETLTLKRVSIKNGRLVIVE